MENSVNAENKMLGNRSSYMPKPNGFEKKDTSQSRVETMRHAPTLSGEEIVRSHGNKNHERLAEMPSPALKKARNIMWPLLTRANQTGVYAELVLKNYFPAALGVIDNIGG